MQAGLDSLAAVDLRRELIAVFGLDADALSPTLVFDYPSVEAIAEHLLPLLPLSPPTSPPPPDAALLGSAHMQSGAGLVADNGPAWLRLVGAQRRQHVLQQVRGALDTSAAYWSPLGKNVLQPS